MVYGYLRPLREQFGTERVNGIVEVGMRADRKPFVVRVLFAPHKHVHRPRLSQGHFPRFCVIAPAEPVDVA